MGGRHFLTVLVGVVLLQERQAIHVTAAQPVFIIPVPLTLPLGCIQTAHLDVNKLPDNNMYRCGCHILIVILILIFNTYSPENEYTLNRDGFGEVQVSHLVGLCRCNSCSFLVHCPHTDPYTYHAASTNIHHTAKSTGNILQFLRQLLNMQANGLKILMCHQIK